MKDIEERVAGHPGGGLHAQLESPRSRLGAPFLAGLGMHRIRARVEDQHREVHRREAIRHRMMELGDHSHAPVLEARREHHLPQRPLAVERDREGGVGERGEAREAERLVVIRQRDDMPRDVEARVVHPERLAEAGGREREPLAEAGREVQPPQDALAERVDSGAVSVGMGLEESAPADVHMGIWGLDPQERAVEWTKARTHHPLLPVGAASWANRESLP